MWALSVIGFLCLVADDVLNLARIDVYYHTGRRRLRVNSVTAGVFIETHQDPDHAPSDGATMLPIGELPALLERLLEIDSLVKRG